MQNGPKIKSSQNLLKLGTFGISNMPISISMSKMIFVKYLPPTQIGHKIKNAQDLLKFAAFDISNIPISILMSKTIFIKHLPITRPKLFPK